MEKILKLIRKLSLLVPFLIISLSIKNVYALDKMYFNFNGEYSWGIFNDNRGFSNSPQQFITYNNNNYNTFNYNLEIANYWNRPINHFILFYNETYNFYFLTFFSNYYDDSIINYNYNLSDKKMYYCSDLENCNNSVSSTYNSFCFLSESNVNLKTILSTNYDFTSPSSYYKYAFCTSSYSEIYNIFSNFNDFKVVYNDKLNFYIDNISVEPEEPEDPEEPDTPTLPPYNFINNKYYVPNYQEGNCVEIIDKDTIRVFENESSNNYIDYYINSHYVSKTGQVEVDYIKQCSNLEFTNIRYYGNDFPEILFITICIVLFTLGFPYILYKRFRKR